MNGNNHIVYNPSMMQTININNPQYTIKGGNMTQIFNRPPDQHPQQLQHQQQLPHQQSNQLGHYVLTRNINQPSHMLQQSSIFKVPPGLTDRIANALQVKNLQPQTFGSMQVTPIYNPPNQAFPQQKAINMPSVSSMMSPPMENANNVPRWQNNAESVQNQNCKSQYFAMSSFLTDDRLTETPAPIPIECHLGPDTPSPSLPSASPEEIFNLVEYEEPENDPQIFDTSELLRMTLAEDLEDKFVKKRKLSDYDEDYISPVKRNRRTKAEILAAKLEDQKRLLKPCSIVLKPLQVKSSVRVFRGNSKTIMIREDMPRVRRMKLSPQEMVKVVNIGFLKTNHGIVLSCCMSHCKFKSYDSEKFVQHLLGHGDGIESGLVHGECELCKRNFSGNSLVAEFKHMVMDHIVNQIRLGFTYEILYSTIKIQKDENDESEEDDFTLSEKADDLLSDYDQEMVKSALNEIDNIFSPTTEEILEEIEEPVADTSDTDFEPSDEALTSDEEDFEETQSEKESSRSDRSRRSSRCSHKNKLRKRKVKTKRQARSRSIHSRSSSVSTTREERIILKISGNSSNREARSEIIKTFKRKRRSSSRDCNKSVVSSPEKEPKAKKQNKEGSAEALLPTQPNICEQVAVANLSETDKNVENSRHESLANSPEDSDADFLHRIPLSIMEKIKQAKTSPNQEQAKPNEINEHETKTTVETSLVTFEPPQADTCTNNPIKKVQILEDIVIQPKKRGRRKKDFEGLPTCRKSTSVSSKPQSDNDECETGKLLPTARKRSSRQRKSYEDFSDNEVKNVVLREFEVRVTRCETNQDGNIVLKVKENETIDPFQVMLIGDSMADKIEEIGSEENNVNEEVKDSTVTIESSSELTKKDEEDEVFYDSVDNLDVDLPPTPHDSQDTQENQPEELKRIVDIYPLMEPEDFKSWVKTKSCLDVLLTEECLFATYKCMSIRCSFYTNDKTEFSEHLTQHEDSDSFFLCSVCLLEEKTPIDLLEHLEENHQFDRYQCGKCMYRACEKFYCDKHREKFHKDDKAPILRGAQSLTKKIRSLQRESLLRTLDEHVKPFKCKFCSKTFFVPCEYLDHLQNESEMSADREKFDAICNEIAEINLKEASEICEIGVIRCLYCTDGFNDLRVIQEHLAEVHPSKMAFVCSIEKKDFHVDIENPSKNIVKYIHIKDLVDVKSAEHKKLCVKMHKPPTDTKRPLLIIESAYSLTDGKS